MFTFSNVKAAKCFHGAAAYTQVSLITVMVCGVVQIQEDYAVSQEWEVSRFRGNYSCTWSSAVNTSMLGQWDIQYRTLTQSKDVVVKDWGIILRSDVNTLRLTECASNTREGICFSRRSRISKLSCISYQKFKVIHKFKSWNFRVEREKTLPLCFHTNFAQLYQTHSIQTTRDDMT